MTCLSRADRNIHPACLHPFSAAKHVQAMSVEGEKKKKNMEWTRGRKKKSAFLLTGACVGRDRIKTNDATETQQGGSLGFKGKLEPFWGCYVYAVSFL